MKAASVLDYRELARARLPRFLFDYIDGGAYDEVTLRRNVSDLAQVALRQRVLRDVSAADPSTTLLGERLSMPVVLAPVGLGGLNARRGEVQAAVAAKAAGVPFCLSTVSACPIAEVAAGGGAPFWFQLYMIRDRPFMEDLLAEARRAGCRTLAFTVDLPLAGARYRDVRSGLSGAPGLGGDLRRLAQAMARPAWAWDVGVRGRPLTLGNIAAKLGPKAAIGDFFGWLGRNFDASITWDDLAWVRARWDGPLIIKGVLDPDDARAAIDQGADGIVVSNHGGRQLDGVASSARALPAIVRAVEGRIAVLADGGVRSGLDVVRMLALGAQAVMIGRPWVWALGARGQAGVAHVLELMRAEMMVAMALCGVTRVADIDAGALFVD